MKILLLVTAFNAQTQAVYTKLKDDGHLLSVAFAISEEQMSEEIQAYKPDLILAPLLKSYLPSSIYKQYAVYIFHPGPKGDRGPNSLEYALKSKTKEWGVVVLKADSEYDGGNIYANQSFKVRDTYKASLYRQEVARASVECLEQLFVSISENSYVAQDMQAIHREFKQKDRAINWSNDSTEIIIKKIYLSDSYPGVLDEILGVECYLFGAHKEEKFRGNPKEILAKRDGAICLGTIDGAVWISHLKAQGSFKLPATYVLKEKLQGIKEERLPLIFDRSYETFYEISLDIKERVAYLHFNFHNGAMSTAQCIRLKYAIGYISNECDVLVLMGGEDFFSNGIHLNILEDSQKQGEDGWANINAMNELVKSIIYADRVVTIGFFKANAGAGGVFMGLACDYVVGLEDTVLNPHYKSLGLSGSEYHTYTLPKRVGTQTSKKLVDGCLPISVAYAKELGMIDEVFDYGAYKESLHIYALSKYDDEFVWAKQDYLEENRAKIEAFKEREIQVMHSEFWDDSSEFHTLRKDFVYKKCPTETPKRLKSTMIKDKQHA